MMVIVYCLALDVRNCLLSLGDGNCCLALGDVNYLWSGFWVMVILFLLGAGCL